MVIEFFFFGGGRTPDDAAGWGPAGGGCENGSESRGRLGTLGEPDKGRVCRLPRDDGAVN